MSNRDLTIFISLERGAEAAKVLVSSLRGEIIRGINTSPTRKRVSSVKKQSRKVAKKGQGRPEESLKGDVVRYIVRYTKGKISFVGALVVSIKEMHDYFGRNFEWAIAQLKSGRVVGGSFRLAI